MIPQPLYAENLKLIERKKITCFVKSIVYLNLNSNQKSLFRVRNDIVDSE